MDEGSDVQLCFWDSSKAFGVVYHQIVSTKLADLGIPHKMVTWIRNFLGARKFQVHIGNALFNEFLAPSVVLAGLSLTHSYDSS